MPKRISALAAAAVALAISIACTPRAAEPVVAQPGIGAAEELSPTPSDAPVTVLGWEFGATLFDVSEAHPGVLMADWMVDSMPWPPETTLAGIPMSVRPTFVEGRLQSIIANHQVAEDPEAAFETLVASVEADLGPADRLRCESDGGPPLLEFLALGHGLLQASWSTDALYAEVRLEPGFGCGEWFGDGQPCAATLDAWFSYRPLAPPVVDDGMSVLGEFESSKASPRTAFPAKRADEACAVDPSEMPQADAFGLPLGVSWADVERRLGAPLEDLGGSIGGTARRFGDSDGRLQLHFYDGCLAVAIFVVEGVPATEEAYRVVQRAARETIGSPGVATRCVAARESETGPPPADGLFTMWRKTEPLEGGLRFERSDDPGAMRIVLEIDYVPLRSHAPEIYFGD